MNKTTKIVKKFAATLAIVFAFCILAYITGNQAPSGSGVYPSLIGIILLWVAMFGIRHIWKDEKKEDKGDDDSSSV